MGRYRYVLTVLYGFTAAMLLLVSGCSFRQAKNRVDDYRIRFHPATGMRDYPVQTGDGERDNTEISPDGDTLFFVIRGRL